MPFTDSFGLNKKIICETQIFACINMTGKDLEAATRHQVTQVESGVVSILSGDGRIRDELRIVGGEA